MKTVPELLKEKIFVFEEKGKKYGHTYNKFGIVMDCIVGNTKVEGIRDWNRMGLFFMIVHKVLRLGNNILGDKPSLDSVKDLQVYAAMLEEKLSAENEKMGV